jgi:NAD(P)-dependent dehydrogenase (short-subunit alcohol dehydrogenase family)
LKKIAQPEEIANAVAFLAMNKSSYITGKTIIVDGGYLANQ